MVKCRAIVDIVHEPPPGAKGLTVFRVEVWGISPYDFVRIYEIREKSDNIAAQEGIRRFVDEMERKFPEGK
jgi:hypothetical protein